MIDRLYLRAAGVSVLLDLRDADVRVALWGADLGEDGDRRTVDMREPGDEGRAIERFELVELGPVDQSRNDLVHVIGRADIFGNDPVQLFRIVNGVARLDAVQLGILRRQGADDVADDGQRMLVIIGKMIDHA